MRLLAGLAAASLITAGTLASTWAVTSKGHASADPSAKSERHGAHTAAMPAAASRSYRLPAQGIGFAKGARPVRSGARGAGEAHARPLGATVPAPLSGDAFERRFPAVSSLAPSLSARGLFSRFVAARLLARPKADAVRTAFARGAAPTTGEAAVFHPLKPAATLAPAEGAAVAALSAPDPLKLKATEKPAEPATASEAVSAPIVLASLPDSMEQLPFSGRPRAGRRGRLAELGLEPPPKSEVPANLPRGGEKPEKPVATLAFAKPNNPMEEEAPAKALIPWPGSKKRVAYYDISAGVVHMPGGERLEAHSGRGTMRDNPKFAHVRMRGPTPPSTYRLSMREALFHGVEAIRLTPVNGIAPHGRVGLLAHTYLLRNAPPGDSSGCIAFKDYKRFLNAFKRGEVNQIVVVPSMRGKASVLLASASGGDIRPATSAPRER